MPSEFVNDIESVQPGWVDAQLGYWSDWIDARLRKRYDAPFSGPPYPGAVTGWLARMVTVRCFLKRGVDPSDAQFAEVKADDVDARAEIKEAADSETGLFDLPLRPPAVGAVDGSGVVRGFPRAYSEASPYVGQDVQAAIGRNEDAAHRGSGSGNP